MLGQMEAAEKVVKGIAMTGGFFDVHLGIRMLSEMLHTGQVKYGNPKRLESMVYCITYARDLIKNFRLKNHHYKQLGTASVGKMDPLPVAVRELRSLQAGKDRLQAWGLSSEQLNMEIDRRLASANPGQEAADNLPVNTLG